MYTSQTRVENYGGIVIDTSLVTSFTQWVGAAKLWIDNYTGKTFETSGAEDRYYDGCGEQTLLVDSFYGTPTVSILETDGSTVQQVLTQGVDFITGPQNRTEKSEIILMPTNSVGVFPNGTRRIKINATFAVSSTVPADIELVATKLVTDIIDKGLKGGRYSSFSLGDMSMNFQAIDEVADPLGIYSILDRYREITL
jgi:hypothetical protein